MAAYYNEFDPYAAQWLRNLIRDGHIADGEVDERSITEVSPGDLRGFAQCHFFAGIGIWSLALRRAGWPDDLPIWTGSCPCQPFSAAGKRAGMSDERHLWPAWAQLVGECRPPVIAGEQVASRDADAWVDLVQDDLEALGYAFGAVPFPSAGVGAPHIRDRLYWLAYAGSPRLPQRERIGGVQRNPLDTPEGQTVDGRGDPCGMDYANDGGSRERARVSGEDGASPVTTGRGLCAEPGDTGTSGRLGNTNGDGREPRRQAPSTLGQGCTAVADGGACGPGPTNGVWRDADWLLCQDGRWRPVEPGSFPLAHGYPSRVGQLRAYGNAIVAEAARVFISAAVAAIEDTPR